MTEIKRKPKATPNNKFGLKLKASDVRQEAYEQYCAHIASGYPKEAFHFEHPVHSVCWKTMDRYIKENPSEFPAFKMQKAKSKRYMHWLDKGQRLMEGGFKNGSPVVWQTIMRNIFKDEGWDRQDISLTTEKQQALDTFCDSWEKARRERHESSE